MRTATRSSALRPRPGCVPSGTTGLQRPLRASRPWRSSPASWPPSSSSGGSEAGLDDGAAEVLEGHERLVDEAPCLICGRERERPGDRGIADGMRQRVDLRLDRDAVRRPDAAKARDDATLAAY